MADTNLEKNLKAAIENAAAQVAKTTDIDEAERWNGVIRQVRAELDAQKQQ